MPQSKMAIFILSLFIFVPVSSQRVVKGDEGLELDDAKRSEIRRIAIQGMAQSLRNVTQAVCEIDCKYDYKRISDAPQLIPAEEHFEEKIFLAYTKNGLVRYDRKDLIENGRPLQTIITSEFVLVAPEAPSSVQVRAVTRQKLSEVSEPRYRQRDPFVTVISGVRSNNRMQTQAGLTDDLLDRRLLEAEIVQVKYESANRLFLELREPKSKGRFVVFSLTLDRTNGYVPLRVESKHNVTKGQVWTEPEITETQWIRQGDIAIPVDVKVTGTAEYRESLLTFHMKWKNVNEEIPASYFSEESIGTVNGDMIATVEAGDTVVEKLIRREKPADVQVDKLPSPRLRWILLGNFGGLVLLYTIYRWRAARIRSRSS